jgi:SAM-dependent methyltransferase
MVPGVRVIDLRARLPFADGSADAVYHSHVLEHLERGQAAAFLAECRRVLKPGGVLRIAVPDLEGICRRYLRELDAAAASEPGASERHGWMTIELLDQCVRTVPGGEMLKWWCAATVPAEALVRERMGNEFGRFRQWFDAEVAKAGARPGWADAPVPSVPAETEAAFRRQGEIHRWMYDRVSLAALLTRVGFDASRVRVVGALESGIADWARFELDADALGNVHKPDSVFVEAIR